MAPVRKPTLPRAPYAAPIPHNAATRIATMPAWKWTEAMMPAQTAPPISPPSAAPTHAPRMWLAPAAAADRSVSFSRGSLALVTVVLSDLPERVS